MARSVRSSVLETRTSRLRLAKRGKPYWQQLARGLSIGYRRLETAGRWIVRSADGHGKNWTKAFAVADDHEESNSDTVLSFAEAQALARTISPNGAATAGPITVAGALDRYSLDLAARGGRVYNARSARVHLPSMLLTKPVAMLSTHELRAWRDGLLKGRAPATVNRIIVTLSAALELAASLDPRITNRAAWKTGLQKLTGADTGRARNVVLPESAIRELVALAHAESPEFGRLIETAAVTGARRSQLARLQVVDLQNGGAPRLMMPSSLKGKRTKRITRTPVAIPASLAATLLAAAAGRQPTDLLLVKPDGTPWASADLREPFRRIVALAGHDPDEVTPYCLRHSSITRQLLAGVPVRVVAVGHDTSVPMIEKSYSASIADHSDTQVRRSLIDLGQPADDKVVPLARKG
jgi:integrase